MHRGSCHPQPPKRLDSGGAVQAGLPCAMHCSASQVQREQQAHSLYPVHPSNPVTEPCQGLDKAGAGLTKRPPSWKSDPDPPAANRLMMTAILVSSSKSSNGNITGNDTSLGAQDYLYQHHGQTELGNQEEMKAPSLYFNLDTWPGTLRHCRPSSHYLHSLGLSIRWDALDSFDRSTTIHHVYPQSLSTTVH